MKKWRPWWLKDSRGGKKGCKMSLMRGATPLLEGAKKSKGQIVKKLESEKFRESVCMCPLTTVFLCGLCLHLLI